MKIFGSKPSFDDADINYSALFITASIESWHETDIVHDYLLTLSIFASLFTVFVKPTYCFVSKRMLSLTPIPPEKLISEIIIDLIQQKFSSWYQEDLEINVKLLEEYKIDNCVLRRESLSAQIWIDLIIQRERIWFRDKSFRHFLIWTTFTRRGFVFSHKKLRRFWFNFQYNLFDIKPTVSLLFSYWQVERSFKTHWW
jgi:hypothetical protein